MGTALDKIRGKLATSASEYASDETSSGSFFSTRGGILMLGEEELPGNEMLVVVLDAIHENTYYEGAFDPEAMMPPKCFAFGRSEDEMEPHENVPDPDDESDSYFEMQVSPNDEGEVWCNSCPNFAWGSALKGKGKACSSRRRLALIPAGRFVPSKNKREAPDMEVFDEPSHFKKADVSFLKLPVTSTKAWGKYVHELNSDLQLPPFAVITCVSVVSDAKDQFHIEFERIDTIEDPDILEILMKRNVETMEIIEQPYGEPSEEDLDQPKAKAKTGLSNLRKGKKK